MPFLYQHIFAMLFDREIVIRYVHPELNPGFEDIRNVWLLSNPPVLITACLHRGSLGYRLPRSGRRVSYQTLKKGLHKTDLRLRLPFEPLPF
jgi:hypothetical protein